MASERGDEQDREENAQSEPVTNLCVTSRLKSFRGSYNKK